MLLNVSRYYKYDYTTPSFLPSIQNNRWHETLLSRLKIPHTNDYPPRYPIPHVARLKNIGTSPKSSPKCSLN